MGGFVVASQPARLSGIDGGAPDSHPLRSGGIPGGSSSSAPDGTDLIVVSDTSPVLNLARIGRLDLLALLYHQVLIPSAVYEELMRSKSDLPPAIDLRARNIRSRAILRALSPN